MTEAVSRGFRKHGYAGIGVDKLAKDAGVTSGAFYAHFGSKTGAFDIALNAGLDEVIEGLPQRQREEGAAWLTAFVDYYLGKPHRENLECGCAMASLTPEVIRAEAEFRATFEKKMNVIADLIAGGLAGDDVADRRARAWAVLGILIGGLQLARAVQNDAVVDEIIKAVKVAALHAAGQISAPQN